MNANLTSSKRFYSWSCVTYHDRTVIEQFTRTNQYVSHFAYILHNKDNVTPHFHLLVIFRQFKSLRWIEKTLDVIAKTHQNTLGEKIVDRLSAYDYLTHEGSAEKIHYDASEIVCDSVTFWTDEKEEDNRIESIFNDFDKGTSLRTMAFKYGRDFVVNYLKYKEFYMLVKEEESRNLGTQIDLDIKGD